MIQPIYAALKKKQELIRTGVIDLASNLFRSGLNYENYPDLEQTDLIQLYCQQSGIVLTESQSLVTRGSTEGIDLAIRWAAQSNFSEVIIPTPTFPLYAYSAHLNRLKSRAVPIQLDSQSRKLSFELDSKTFSESEDKILFICNPSNPLGSVYDSVFIDDIITRFKGMIVIDEAYIEYSQTPSVISKVSLCKNVIILRTLSKAWGLAGARCGFIFSNPETINSLKDYILPFSTPAMTSEIVISRLNHKKQIDLKIDQVSKLKLSLITQLQTLFDPQSIFPSEASFVFIKSRQSSSIVQHLAHNQIVVEEVSGSLPGFRISVGSFSENAHLIQCLKSIVPQTNRPGLRTYRHQLSSRRTLRISGIHNR